MKAALLAVALLAFTAPVGAARLELTASCNLDAGGRLGASFKGHSPDAVFGYFKKANLTKDEYETSDQFAARRQAAISGAPPAIANGGLCLVSRSDRAEYDADAGKLWVGLFVDYKHMWFDGEDLHFAFQEWSNKRNLKETSYSGSNAYGVSRTVYKSVYETTIVSFEFDQTRSALMNAGAELRETYISFPVKLAPERARSLRGKVSMVVQYEVAPPYTATYEKFELPKIDWPYEDSNKQSIIAAKAKRVAVIASDTGELLASFSLGSSALGGMGFPAFD